MLTLIPTMLQQLLRQLPLSIINILSSNHQDLLKVHRITPMEFLQLLEDNQIPRLDPIRDLERPTRVRIYVNSPSYSPR